MTHGVAYTLEELEVYKKKVLEYLGKTAGGTFAAACKYADLPYSTGYYLRKSDPEWGEAVVAARRASDDLGGDFAESKLMEAINNNELTGIIFYLKTKHKNRGYIEKQETQYSGELNLSKVERVIIDPANPDS
jgi:hypothetical protein